MIAHVTSIAVARFESSQSHEQLGFGFAVLLHEHLRAVRDLRIVPARRTLADDGCSPEELGRRSGVDVVVTGELQIKGEALEVTAILVNPLTERELWADRYSVRCDDVLHVSRGIAERVCAAIGRHVTFGRRHGATAHAWDAFCAYAGARWIDWFGDHDAIVRAARLYERAAVLAPSLTPAVAARACVMMAMIAEGRQDREQLDHVNESAALALRRDRTLPEACAAVGLGFLLHGDAKRAEIYLNRATGLDPLDPRFPAWREDARRLRQRFT